MKLKTLSIDLDPKFLSFDSMRELVDAFLKGNKDAKKFWDCMAALRGPDIGYDGKISLAGNPDGEAEAHRVERKKLTSAIIRSRMFPGAAACSSALMNNDPDAAIVLPDKDKWDHFDKHVFKAAQWLGIQTMIGGQEPVQKNAFSTVLWDYLEDSSVITLSGPNMDLQLREHILYLESAFDGVAGIFARGDGSKFVANVSSKPDPNIMYQVTTNYNSSLVKIRTCGYSEMPKLPTIQKPSKDPNLFIDNYWALDSKQISSVVICEPSQIKYLKVVKAAASSFEDKDAIHIAPNMSQAITADKGMNTFTLYRVESKMVKVAKPEDMA